MQLKRILTLTTPLLLASLALAQKQALDPEWRSVTNRYGAPIVDRAGQPIEYEETQLELQRQRWLASGGSEEDPALGSCEGEIARAAWKYYIFGTGLGSGGLDVSSVGGIPELLMTGGGSGFGGSRYWMVLRHDDASGEYQQEWVSPVYATAGITNLDAEDLADDGTVQVVVTTSNGGIEVWDQATRTQLGGWAQSGGANAMQLFDLDDDGDLEILTCTSDTLRVFSHEGALLWSAPYGGSDLAVGQMDADPAYEIALTSGDVVDGATHTVQWHWADGFGSYLEAGDIDGDGFDEVIAARSWTWVFAFDVDTELPKWSLEIFNIGATHLTDVDADGQLELIIGEAQWGDQLCYDAQTLALEWSLNNPEHGTTEVITGDSDGDGEIEVIWGSGHTSSGSDHLFVGDWVTGEHEWSNVHLDGPLRGPATGDVDGDGIQDLVTVSNESDSGYSAGRILVFDRDTLQLRAISQSVSGGLGWSGTHRVILRNVDADAALEIVVGSSTTYDGTIEIYDFDGSDGSFTKIWEVPNPKPDGPFRDVEVIDVDGDGALEVLGGAEKYVYVYDLATGALEWNSLFVASYIREIAVGDTDGDPALEILALGSTGDLYVFDGQTKAVEALIFGDFTCLRLSPVMVAPDLVLLGDELGHLVTKGFDVDQYVTLSTEDLTGGPIDGFTVRAAEVLFVGSDGVLSIFSPIPNELWKSCSAYGSPFGLRVAFGKDYAVAAGTHGLVAFKRH